MESVSSTYTRRQAEGGRLASLLPNNLRGRFLAVLFGVLLPSLTLFGVLHHESVRHSLLLEVDETLSNRAHEVAQVLHSSGVRTQHDFERFHLVSNALQLTSAPEVYVQIMTDDDRILWTSDNLGGKSMRIPAQEDEVGTATQADGLKLRFNAHRFELQDGTDVRLVAAESLTHLESALKESIGRSMLLGLIVLVLTELMGNLAFRGIFYPLGRLVNTTEEIIDTGDMTQRVRVFENSDPQVLRTAQAFNALLERVEQLLEVAKQLLADTSHELRNPLTALMTDLDLLREELTPEQRDEVVSEAQMTVRRMNRLVSDLLLLSRAEAQPEKLQVEEVKIDKFLRKVGERFSRSVGEDAEVVIFDEMPQDLVGEFNRERTEQIFTNLFENGVRHSDSGTVRVNVYEEPDLIVVSVKDDGCGIAPRDQEKIFHRFYRVDTARDRDSGGTGLGLAVARALARLQGGDIKVVSAVGSGADFQVTLRKGSNGEG